MLLPRASVYSTDQSPLFGATRISLRHLQVVVTSLTILVPGLILSIDYSSTLFKMLQDVNITAILLSVSFFGVCPRDP